MKSLLSNLRRRIRYFFYAEDVWFDCIYTIRPFIFESEYKELLHDATNCRIKAVAEQAKKHASYIKRMNVEVRS